LAISPEEHKYHDYGTVLQAIKEENENEELEYISPSRHMYILALLALFLLLLPFMFVMGRLSVAEQQCGEMISSWCKLGAAFRF
jgi:hypothetical protein